LTEKENQLIQVLLITDAPPSVNGGGIRQTLHQLFVQPGILLTTLVPKDDKVNREENWPFKLVEFDTAPMQTPRNRLGNYFRKWFVRRRIQWYMRHYKLNPGLPDPALSVAVVSTTNPEQLLIAWLLQTRYNYAVIPYFMDDWLQGNMLKWKGNNIQNVAGQLLNNPPATLMISPELESELSGRYKMAPKPCLHIHNPATQVAAYVDESILPGTIIYAGSIWPMHRDALLETAKAVDILQRNGHIQFRLIIHTHEVNWERHPELHHLQGVCFGGQLDFQNCQKVMRKAWLLLCTASFESTYAPFSRTSVQTKLTDYMGAARPILFVGPRGSASCRFVTQWGCGHCLYEANPESIADALQQLALPASQERLNEMAGNGLRAASENFSDSITWQRLCSFLQQIKK
jgi:glycosyltransferase involved in cell wall biosynthesis